MFLDCRIMSFITVAAFLLLQLQYTTAALNGYHYERPASGLPTIITGPPSAPLPAIITGHNFGPLATIAPLPPIPTLPPLPRGGSRSRTSGQSLVQYHPSPNGGGGSVASKSIASLYAPPHAVSPPTSHITQSYPQRTQTLQQQQQQQQQQQKTPVFGQRLSLDLPRISQHQLPQLPQQQQQLFAPTFAPVFDPTAIGDLTGPSAPLAPINAAAATAGGLEPLQPLRIPFGKKAVISELPTIRDVDARVGGGDRDRELKQYAVVEIIDNDIEPESQYQASLPFFDSYRAQIGASGTGATPGLEIQTRADAFDTERQQQQGSSGLAPGDAVALGSGGLGFIRLNGNIYLGSGSLGYVSGQQRSAFVQDARTRVGAPMPDALHFGHGPLGPGLTATTFRRYK